MSAFKNINCSSASNEYTDPPHMFFMEKYDEYWYFLDEKSALSGAMRVIASHLRLAKNQFNTQQTLGKISR